VVLGEDEAVVLGEDEAVVLGEDEAVVLGEVELQPMTRSIGAHNRIAAAYHGGGLRRAPDRRLRG
jgi:hypothetical protein